MASPLRHSAALGLLALAVTAAGSPAAAGPTTAARWAVAGVGAGQRSVVVQYELGGCEARPRARVTETPSTVRIAVTVTDTSAPGRACPQIVRLGRTAVPLRAPLHGRRIVGGRGTSVAYRPPSCHGTIQLPSVLGMAIGDARRLLRGQAFAPEVTRGRGQVVVQHPSGGTCLSPGVTVRLVAAR
jgi:hypothetical protein